MIRARQLRQIAVLIAVIGVVASGCALGTRRVNLVYGPGIDRSVGSPGPRGRIAIARLRDARSSSEGTGTLLAKVRNAYGMETASVEANQDPVLWVNEGLARALSSQGFNVEKVESAASAAELATVTGSVTRASGGMYMKTDATIGADLTIERRGQRLLSMACEGSAIKMAWTASAHEFGDVFSAAMDDFVAKCVPQLVPVLSDNVSR
jgi:hypothetical protein